MSLPNGEAVAFRADANARAYYFVDVVAAAGPAPVSFAADRASRLGSPGRVARAGETNRVPLLVGIAYAVTSTVPVAVSAAAPGGFAEIEADGPCAYTVRWPLGFEAAREGRATTFRAVPYDPGGTFEWTSGAGARAHRAARSGGCPFTAGGGTVAFDCSGGCGCGGCSVAGTYRLVGASFEPPPATCGCREGDDDDDNPLGPDPPPPVPSTGGITVSFTLTPRNIGKLAPEGGTGPLSLPSGGTLAPGETYSATFECSGVEASGAEGDVAVSASFPDAGTGETQGDEAKLTVVRVEIRSTVDPPDPSARSINRHTYGVCERIELLQFPGSPKVAWEPVGGGTLDSESFYSCPLSGCRNPLRASCAGISYTPQIEVVEPDGVKAELLYGTTRESVITYGVPRGKAGGIGMWLRLSVKPFHVSFSRIAVQEVVSFTYDASGYFSNPYFNGVFAHSGGIVGAGAGIWHDIDEDNYFSDDEAAYNAVVPWLTQKGIPTNDPACSWTSGYVYMDNPFGWNKKGTSGDETVYKRIAEDVQDEIMIDAVGTVGVRKLFNQVTRTTNDVIHVNGRRIQ